MENSKPRIEFIDLAKGICVLLVVLYHCQINIEWLQILRIPLYFALSGIFFKTYNCFDNFLVRKINKLIIPFLFFYLTAYAIFHLLLIFAPFLLITEAKGIMDIFTQRELFNTPIWFLVCLFWSNILFFSAYRITQKKKILLPVVVILFASIGYALGQYGIFLPLFFDAALTSMPFFYFGYLLERNGNVLYRNKYDRWNTSYIIILCGSFFLIANIFRPDISLFSNMVEGGLSAYFCAFCLILAFLLLCKMVEKIPLISYFGRYSIIILCTHHLVYRPIKLIGRDYFSGYALAFIVFGGTIVISYFLIPICLKYIPYFVAQKDLLKPKNL